MQDDCRRLEGRIANKLRKLYNVLQVRGRRIRFGKSGRDSPSKVSFDILQYNIKWHNKLYIPVPWKTCISHLVFCLEKYLVNVRLRNMPRLQKGKNDWRNPFSPSRCGKLWKTALGRCYLVCPRLLRITYDIKDFLSYATRRKLRSTFINDLEATPKIKWVILVNVLALVEKLPFLRNSLITTSLIFKICLLLRHNKAIKWLG